METLAKIAPFMRKAGVAVVGRERLFQLRNKLAYILITNDISENTRQMVLETFKCPVYQCLTSEDIEKLFNYKGTKLLGFRRSPMSNSALADLRPFKVARNEDAKRTMKQFIAYCGLDCESCEARKATIDNNDDLRKKVAKEWSELNGVEITPEMINCTGCRIAGAKTPYSDKLCQIRQCAMARHCNTCGDCAELKSCEKVGMIVKNNPDALNNLKG